MDTLERSAQIPHLLRSASVSWAFMPCLQLQGPAILKLLGVCYEAVVKGVAALLTQGPLRVWGGSFASSLSKRRALPPFCRLPHVSSLRLLGSPQ